VRVRNKVRVRNRVGARIKIRVRVGVRVMVRVLVWVRARVSGISPSTSLIFIISPWPYPIYPNTHSHP
jgi:hypothetical protein